mmetsp:Transcript_25635/g.62846  ORF Transcript_25635/g.62846 Transcript_25635/m.62846 type:complete len:137 (-) Transcript_25635:180-590(-)
MMWDHSNVPVKKQKNANRANGKYSTRTGKNNNLRVDCGGALLHSIVMIPNTTSQIPEVCWYRKDSFPVSSQRRKAKMMYAAFVRVASVVTRQRKAVEPMLRSSRRPGSEKLINAMTRERNLLHNSGLRRMRYISKL